LIDSQPIAIAIRFSAAGDRRVAWASDSRSLYDFGHHAGLAVLNNRFLMKVERRAK
jgi:hypothetical protein